MKSINAIKLAFTFLILVQVSCQAEQFSPELIAHRLTQESYITPAMQWAVLSFLDAQSMTINTQTGAVQGIESINNIINTINKKLEISISLATKESMKNALHAMLEATDIAIFVAATEAAYSNQKYIIYQEVDSQLAAALQEQKNNIQEAISRVNATIPYNPPSTSMSSYFSWFTGTSTPEIRAYNAEPLHFKQSDQFITIPESLVQAIIKKNDYKLQDNPQDAAELLFKECFIAQQHHLKDRIDKLKIKLKSPLKDSNYIFSEFHSFKEICEIAQKITSSQQVRRNLEDFLTQDHMTAHKLLLDTRQAIQTALYIANAKSSYNVGYILPASVTSYLNTIVGKLLEYDAQVSILCKDPRYGATQDDIYRDEIWSGITKVAAGTLAATVIAGGIYFFAPAAAITSLITGTAGTTGTAIKGATALTTAQQLWKAGETVKGYTDTIGTVGSTVASVGSKATFAANLIQTLDKSGAVSLDDIDPNARYIVDLAKKVGTGVSIVGGAGTAIGGVATAVASVATAADAATHSKSYLWSDDYVIDKKTGQPALDAKGNKLYKSNSALYNATDSLWNTGKAISSGMNAASATQSALTIGAVAASSANQLAASMKNNQPSENILPQVAIDKIPSQTIANVFTKFINDGVGTDGMDPLEKIAKASQSLLQEQKTTPAALTDALQKVQQNVQQNNMPNPTITQGLNQIIQKVTSLSGNTQQAA